MGKIRYSNYFVTKIDSKFTSNYSLVDVQRSTSNVEYITKFKLGLNYDNIRNQAVQFAVKFVSLGLFKNSFLDNYNRIDLSKDAVTDAYIYSYFKSVYYSVGRCTKANFASFIQGNSLVFYGHKVLFDHICTGYMNHNTLINSHISMQIDVDDTIIPYILENDVISKFIDYKGDFFNSKYETILNYMMVNCSTHVSVCNLNDDNEFNNLISLNSSPLGNLCFSEDEQSLLYVENKALTSDKKSYFWGKAVCISCIEFPSVDVDDSIYDTIPVSRYDKRNVSFEVESITGLKFYDIRSLDYFGNYNVNNPNKHDPDDTIKSSTKKDDFTNRKKSNQRRNSTKLNMVDEVVRFSGKAINVIRNSKIPVTKDNVFILFDLIKTITNKKLRNDIINSWYGKSIESILSEYNIKPEKSLFEEEYRYFYGQKENDKIKIVGFIDNK